LKQKYQMLFKYVSNPTLILEEGYIRATQLSALNDPFEAVYCKEGIRDLACHFEFATPDSVVDHIETNKHKIGVICLTEAKDNLLMWSHYANEYKGALIGLSVTDTNACLFANLKSLDLDSTNAFGDSKYDVFDGSCDPVQYRKQPRYRLDRYDFDYGNICVAGEDQLLFEIFQRKSDEWSYEKEHRVILRLEQADLAIIEDIDSLHNPKLLEALRNTGICTDTVIDGKNWTRIAFDQLGPDEKYPQVWSKPVAELARNPANLYLFKLNSSAISSLILGHRADMSILKNIPSYPLRTGYFNTYRTVPNFDNYTMHLV